MKANFFFFFTLNTIEQGSIENPIYSVSFFLLTIFKDVYGKEKFHRIF